MQSEPHAYFLEDRWLRSSLHVPQKIFAHYFILACMQSLSVWGFRPGIRVQYTWSQPKIILQHMVVKSKLNHSAKRTRGLYSKEELLIRLEAIQWFRFSSALSIDCRRTNVGLPQLWSMIPTLIKFKMLPFPQVLFSTSSCSNSYKVKTQYPAFSGLVISNLSDSM